MTSALASSPTGEMLLILSAKLLLSQLNILGGHSVGLFLLILHAEPVSEQEKRGLVKSSSGPEPDVDCSAPRLTTADLIQRRKAPLMPDTGVRGGKYRS